MYVFGFARFKYNKTYEKREKKKKKEKKNQNEKEKRYSPP